MDFKFHMNNHLKTSVHTCAQCSHASVGLAQAHLKVFMHFNLSGVGTVAAIVALAATILGRKLIFITCLVSSSYPRSSGMRLNSSSLFVASVLCEVTCIHFRLKYTIR